MARNATGAAARFGWLIDAPSDNYDIGHPGLEVETMTAPAAAPTATPGAAGAVTGTPSYRMSYGYGQFETTPGPQIKSAAATAQLVALAVIPTSADTRCDRRHIYRSEDVEPDAPSAVLAGAGAGNVNNGVHLWATTWVTPDGESDMSLTDSLNVVDKTLDGKVTVTPAGTPPSSATGWRIYRTVAAGTALLYAGAADILDATFTDNLADSGLGAAGPVATHYYRLQTLYDNTTTTATDDIAYQSALLNLALRPRTVSNVGGNFGALFLAEPESVDAGAEYKQLVPKTLVGDGRAILISIDGAATIKQSLSMGAAVPALTAAAGKPAVTTYAGEPTRKFVWDELTARDNARTATLVQYEGLPTLGAEFLTGYAGLEWDLACADGKLVDDTMKFVGVHHSLAGPATKVSGTGTYKGTFLLLGLREDTLAATDLVLMKVTQAYSAGAIKVKFKIGSGASYGTEVTIPVNTTSKRAALNLQGGDFPEVVDESGYPIGADTNGRRVPVLLAPSHPLDTLAVDDIYTWALTCPVPGVGAAPYTGVAPVNIPTLQFGPAHFGFTVAGANLGFNSFAMKFMFPRKAQSELGSRAMTAIDMPFEGDFGLTCTAVRLLKDRTWEQRLQLGTRVAAIIGLTGERIPINPGVKSTYRESISISVPQFVVTGIKRASATVGSTPEAITMNAERPDDTELGRWLMTMYTRVAWRMAA